MDILREAKNYAAGKLNDALTEVIAQAYIEGYKEGFRSREKEISLPNNSNTEFVDLGLPSGTLWAIDYERDNDNELLYLPYLQAERMNIPKEEQCKELYDNCIWKYEYDVAKCIGLNGNYIEFDSTGKIVADNCENVNNAYFWIKNEIDSKIRMSVIIRVTIDSVPFFGRREEINSIFMGNKIPIRLVK